ncbi:helicase-related protein, partial [Pseudomonas syringae group genomosp. 7]|uniref:helicase-related protein n=1 Tax=Pseudomonas syringae group genomosp. 7 TaxID=251699 RepID=UPI00377037DB
HKRINVLIASTIIETGINVPSANTIIIELADKFGLAQLHPLRGRVGRCQHEACACRRTPARHELTPGAANRLGAVG